MTHGQLRALGVGRGAIRSAIARGRLQRLHRGVYALIPGSALPPLAAEQAAVLACGEDAYLSRHWAAAVWEFRPAARGAVEVTVVRRKPSARPGIRIHHVPRIDPRDVRTHDGLPITSPARTLLDIACDLSEREFERAFDEAMARGLVTFAAARAVLSVNRGRPGARRMRALALADRKSTMTRSEAEEMFLALLRRSGLPLPEVNARVGRFEVDFCWRQERVIVEIDGYAFHSSRAALERDHKRDLELQQLGYLVIRVSWRQLRNHPEQVLVWIAGALAKRAA